MANFTMRAKSALLAGAMIVSTSSSCFEFSNPLAGITNNPTALSAAVVVLAALKVRLDTKPRGTYDYTNWQADIIDLLNAYNIFDAESRATIKNFVDKYFVGAKFKLDDQMIRVKEEDGTVVTTKRKKVTQKPSGLMGNVDAYVLQQMNGITDLLPAAAALYLLTRDPQGSWNKAQANAMGEGYLKLV